MSERIVRTQQASLVVNLGQVLVKHLLAVYDRTHLQQIEFSRAVVVYIACELYLNRTPHALGSVFHSHLHQFGQRESPVLQDAAERNHLPAFIICPLAQHVVIRIESRGYVCQGTVLVGIRHVKLENIKSVVNLKVVAYILHVKSIKLCLRLTKRKLHLTCLHDMVRMIRTYAQRLSSVYDILTQSERKTRNALL